MSKHYQEIAKPKPKRYRFIGCEILYREACHLAARAEAMVDVEFLRKGLHDLETVDMVSRIQSTIDGGDPDVQYEAILLGYARCNDGLVGVTARDIPLVIPKAHDCITLFFGSREAYMEYFNAHPGTYYMTTGWVERNNFEIDSEYAQPAYGKTGVMGKLGLTDSYEEMVEKYGKENADFIVESTGGWQESYSGCLYLKMGVCDESCMVDHCRGMCKDKDWSFEVRDGDMTLLERLFAGDWDDDFLIVPPGHKIIALNDENVIGIEKC